MDKFQLQKLRDLPLSGVAERLGLAVRKGHFLCPSHEDHTPSASISVARNTWRCWACGAHGGTIDLAMQVLGKSFVEACEWLANEHNVIISDGSRRTHDDMRQEGERKFDASRYSRYFDRPWLSPDARKFLFDVRRLHPAVVRFCRLNSFREWLQIPYYNQQGELIGIQRRYMGTDRSQPRFRFQQGERCHLYCQQVIPMLRTGDDLYLGEGPSDVWALLSSGKKAIGIPSATLLMPEDVAILSSLAASLSLTFHIYPDADSAGERLYQKLVSAANDNGWCIVRHDLPEGCKDFSDYWVKVLSMN